MEEELQTVALLSCLGKRKTERMLKFKTVYLYGSSHIIEYKDPCKLDKQYGKLIGKYLVAYHI